MHPYGCCVAFITRSDRKGRDSAIPRCGLAIADCVIVESIIGKICTIRSLQADGPLVVPFQGIRDQEGFCEGAAGI